MREVMVTGNLVESRTLDSDTTLTAVLPRREIEAALHGGDALALWFDIAGERDDETMRLTVEMSSTDAEQALELSKDDDLVFALDAGSLEKLYGDPDVEAHGMRGALAIAVTTAAIAAPAGLAATPQVSSTALKPEVAKTALKPEVARTALKPEVARTALKPEVARTALKQQVANRAVTRQVVRLVVTAAGVNAWR